MRALVAVVCVSLSLSGCAPAGEASARNVSDRFQTALAGHDAASACQLLSQEARRRLEVVGGKPCARVLPALNLPAGGVREVGVWGDNGQARLASGVLFLAEFKAGWRVIGAGCRPRPEMPYDCVVEG